MKLAATSLKGTYTALLTPFSADGSSLDLDSLANLIEFQLSAGVDGLVACGSTGEAATLSDEEYKTVLSSTKRLVKDRVPVIGGIGASATSRAVTQAEVIESLGLDGVLLVTPPYNKPSQEGIQAHFRAVKKACSLPIVAYNIPGRAVVNMAPATLASMAKEGLIIGVKDSTGSLDQVIDLYELVRDQISIVSGEDSLVQAIMACGGKGVISASANIAPELFVKLTSAASKGDFAAALQAQLELLPIVRLMFAETNPVPVKAALAIKGVIKSGMPRLPLLPAKPETCERIKSLLKI